MATKFNYSKLKGRIVEKYGFMRAFVKELPFTDMAMANKMQGRTAFKNDEIVLMARLLEIPKEEIADYFFCVED